MAAFLFKFPRASKPPVIRALAAAVIAIIVLDPALVAHCADGLRKAGLNAVTPVL